MLQKSNYVERLLFRVGAQGRYQQILFLIFALKWLIAAMILFSLNFIYFTPSFQCSQPIFPFDSCDNFVCSNPNPQFWINHLPTSRPSSISLDYEIILLCDNTWIASVLQSISYLGSFVGYIVMGHVADNYGRKFGEKMAWMLTIVGVILVGISFNLEMVGIGSFLMGFGCNATITLHYSFIKELVGKELRGKMFLGLQISFEIGVFLIAFLSMMIWSWRIIFFSFIVFPSLLLIFVNSFVKETITFCRKDNLNTLLQTLNKISKTNQNTPLQINQLQQILQQQPNQDSTKQTQRTFIDLFRYKSLCKISLICAAINISIEYIYDGSILSLDKIGVNVYVNQILVGFVDLIASVFATIIVVRISRKKYLLVAFFFTCLCTTSIGIITLFYNESVNINLGDILQLIILGFLRFSITSLWGIYFVFVGQLYPSTVTSLSMGWVSAMGTVGACVAPFVRLITANYTMFSMGFISIIAIILITRIPETKDKITKIDIQQIQNQKNESIKQDYKNIIN